MKLSTSSIESLPHLAWLADVNSDANETHLLHGDWVEIRDGFFVEGVWNGDFADGGFDKADSFFGSGGVVHPDRMVFVSSASTTDYLYYRHSGKNVVVSNSLPFLLAYCRDELDPHNASYTAWCDSIVRGIDEYRAHISTRNGEVRRLLFRNLVVENGAVRLVDKPLCEPFDGYQDYVDFVAETYRAIIVNARDGGRRQELKILSTQSKGYDSTAVNALASRFGIDMAFTVSGSKGAGAFAEQDALLQGDDDGTDIANRLGFPCVAIDRRRFQDDLNDEYLYFAGIANCEDLNFSGITPHIKEASILLTGTLGEFYYPRSNYVKRYGGIPLGTELRRFDLGGGHGLTEVRLETGFIQLPLIYIGAQQRESITRITNSPEMDDWRLNTDYDRPIPRRLAEEAGLPRESFGQKKMATTVSYARPNIPHGAELRLAFFSFLRKEGLLKDWQLPFFSWVHWYNARVWFASPKQHRYMYYLARLKLKLFGTSLELKWKKLDSSLYCFSVNKRAADYREIVSRISLDESIGKSEAKPPT
jgi:hypothetical protein